MKFALAEHTWDTISAVGRLGDSWSEGACTTGSPTILYPVVHVRPKASELLAENYRALAVYYAIHAEVSRFVSRP